MPRNVALSLLRVPWRASQKSTSLRTYTSEAQPEPESPQPPRTHSENLRILRHADQIALIDSKIRLNALIEQVNRIRAHISALPTTIQISPEFPPYINSALRARINDLPKLSEAVIDRAEHVKEHLTDLQYAGYEDDGKDGSKEAAAMRALEEEMQGWSRQEKKDKLRSWQYEVEAKRARLNDSSRRLLEFVKEMRSASQAPQAAPRAAAKVENGREMTPPSRDEELGEVKAAAATAATERAKGGREREKKAEGKQSKPTSEMGLAELQEQLKKSMDVTGGKG